MNLAVCRKTSVIVCGFPEILAGDDFDAVDFSEPGGNHPDEIVIAPILASDDPGIDIQKQKLAGNSCPLSPRSKTSTARSPPPLFHPQCDGETAAPRKDTPNVTDARNYIQATDVSSLRLSPPSDVAHKAPAHFFTARAAEVLQGHAGHDNSVQAPAFNLHHESPSIRKTAGIDHTKSKSISRDLISLPPSSSPMPNGIQDHRTNLTIMQNDKAKRIGMPVSTGSPMQNRGSYKVPQMKRPIRAMPSGALSDVTITSINGGDGRPIAKKQKITDEAHGDDRNVTHV